MPGDKESVRSEGNLIARLCAITLLAAMLSGCSRAAVARVHPDWQLYYNHKYGYQIEYPDGYDVWETGPEGERDGASIRIALHEHQAITPALDICVTPKDAAQRIYAPGILLDDLSLQTLNSLVNGLPAREARYTWKATGHLAYVDIEADGVLYRFMAGPAMTADFYQTDWYAILSTFRFDR